MSCSIFLRGSQLIKTFADANQCDCIQQRKCLSCLKKIQPSLNLVNSISLTRSADICATRCRNKNCKEHACSIGGRGQPIMRTAGCDYFSFLNVVTQSPEHCVAVILQTEIEPNSAPSWYNYKTARQCTQLLFFDSRRTLNTLLGEVCESMVLCHTKLRYALPAYTQRVNSKNFYKCVCQAHACPGSKHRDKQTGQGGSVSTDQSLAGYFCDYIDNLTYANGDRVAPCNSCELSSSFYDKLSFAGTYCGFDDNAPEMADDSKERMIEKAHLLRGVLDTWRVYDSVSELPLFFMYPEETNAPVSTATGKTPLHEHNSLAKSTDHLHLQPIDVDEVIRAHATSDHSTYMCALRYEEMAKQPNIANFIKTNPYNYPAEEIDKKITAMCEETLERVGKSAAAHPVDCACLMYNFISHHCSKQLTLKLVPRPSNPLYKSICSGGGDIIHFIESAASREYFAKRAIGTLINEDRIKPEACSLSAERSHPTHHDMLIVRDCNLRTMMTRTFGDFKFKLDPNERAFRFYDVSKPQPGLSESFLGYRLQTPLPDNSSYMRAETVRGLSGYTYNDAIEQAKRLFNQPDADSFVRIAYNRGLMKDTSVFHQIDDCLTPLLRRALAHFESGWMKLPTIAKHMIEPTRENGKQLFGPECERSIFFDVQQFANRRATLARFTDCSVGDTFGMGEYVQRVFFIAVTAIVVCQFDELAICLSKEKAEQARIEKEKEEAERAKAAQEAREQKAEKEEQKRRAREAKRTEKKEKAAAAAAEALMEKKKKEAETKKKQQQKMAAEEKEKKKTEEKKEEKVQKKKEMAEKQGGGGGEWVVIEKAKKKPPKERLDESICRAVQFNFFDFLSDPYWMSGATFNVLAV